MKKDKGKKENMIQKLCSEFGEIAQERLESSKYEIENNVDVEKAEEEEVESGNNNNNNNESHS